MGARQDRNAQAASDEAADAATLIGLEEDSWREACFGGGADQELAEACALAVADELLAGEVDHADLIAAGERMTFGQHHDELFHQDLLQREAVALDALGDGQEG